MKKKIDVPLPAPNPSCAVCNHVQRSAALSMFELAATPMEIALALHVDVEAVEHHFKVCIPAVAEPSPEDAGSVSDEQLQTLLRHSVEVFHTCNLTGNAVGCAAALSVRLRTLNEMQRRAELSTEQEEALSGCNPLDAPSQWKNRAIRKFVQQYLDGLILSAEREEVNQ